MNDKIISYILTIGGFGITIFFIRKWVNDLSTDVKAISKDVKSQDEKRQKCREELPVKYADKKETATSISKIYSKMDVFNAKLSGIVGRLNGGGIEAE